MPKFRYESIILLILPFFVMASLLFIFFYAFKTTFFVPNAENVPFVQEMQQETAHNNKENIVPLHQAHRTEQEVKDFITTFTSEALSFNKSNFSTVIKKNRPLFTDSGFKKYRDYLLSSNILELIRTKGYEASLYTEAAPLLINSMTLDDKYKWLFEVPVVLTLFPQGDKKIIQRNGSYKNQNLMIRLQLTRAKIEDDTNAILIEDWVVLNR